MFPFFRLRFTSVFILHSSFNPLPAGYGAGPSFAHPVILRPGVPAEEVVGGLPSPGAREKLASMSRAWSSLAVIGESDPRPGPNNSEASSWNIW